MAFYIWLLVGLLLLGLELFIPGVVLVFFGAGSIFVAIWVLIIPIPSSLQILMMLSSSIIFLILFRNRILNRLVSKDKVTEYDSELGQKVKVVKTIKPGLTGKVELHGSFWRAEAQRDDLEIPKGSWVIVRGRKNLVLIVELLK